jgi:hypothetical protein
VFDYLASYRITTLVREKISGIIGVAYRSCAFPTEAGMRVTVFAAIRHRPGFLRQICPYYPSGRHSSYRRGISVSKGIIGLCFRWRETHVEAIADPSAFRRQMIEK